MSDANLFQEVQEDLERKKFEALAKRYGGVALVVASIIILGTAAFTAYRSHETEKNQLATGGLFAIVSKQDTPPAQEALALKNFADERPASVQAFMAELQAAELKLKDGHKDIAITIYDRLAKSQNVSVAFTQYADLMSVRTQMDDGNVADLLKRLDVLAQHDAPWRFEAMEYQAYLNMRAGDKDKARNIFVELSQNASAPHTLSVRAETMARYLQP